MDDEHKQEHKRTRNDYEINIIFIFAVLLIIPLCFRNPAKSLNLSLSGMCMCAAPLWLQQHYAVLCLPISTASFLFLPFLLEIVVVFTVTFHLDRIATMYMWMSLNV